MTMIITIEMSSEQELQLRDGIAQQNQENVQKLLAHLLAPTVEDLLRQEIAEPTYDEFEKLLDEFSMSYANDVPLLSEYAVSRASMYEDETL